MDFLQSVMDLVQQHQPWLEKAGEAAVTKGVKDLWELVKAKLGRPATEKVEAKPDDAEHWKSLEARLRVALEDDPEFLKKMEELAARSEQEGAGISQTATGDANKQAAVANSKNVKISIS
jgi:hypothetical protein